MNEVVLLIGLLFLVAAWAFRMAQAGSGPADTPQGAGQQPAQATATDADIEHRKLEREKQKIAVAACFGWALFVVLVVLGLKGLMAIPTMASRAPWLVTTITSSPWPWWIALGLAIVGTVLLLRLFFFWQIPKKPAEQKKPLPGEKKARFWARLADARDYLILLGVLLLAVSLAGGFGQAGWDITQIVAPFWPHDAEASATVTSPAIPGEVEKISLPVIYTNRSILFKNTQIQVTIRINCATSGLGSGCANSQLYAAIGSACWQSSKIDLLNWQPADKNGYEVAVWQFGAWASGDLAITISPYFWSGCAPLDKGHIKVVGSYTIEIQ